jgi:hypothetical protein
MSNIVWVTWKDAAGKVLLDTVDELPDNARIKDLRKKFVNQQKLEVGPATLSVFEKEDGAELSASKELKDYFAPPSGSAAQSGPGKSHDTALVVSFPPQHQQNGELHCCSRIFVFLIQLLEYENIFFSFIESQSHSRSARNLEKATGLPSHFTPVLLALAVNSMDGWDRITADRTVSDSSTVCNAAVAHYGLASRKHCQILGERTEHVLNAHIWPDHNKNNLVLVDLKPSDIDYPKNILRLHRGIKRYFDHKQLTFTQAGAEFHLKVLDPAIKTQVLEDTNVALNDLDGSPLIFLIGHMPWRRLLATHSILAHRHARNNGWLPEDKLTTAELNANDLMEFSLDAETQA